jgi:hypothetical protein
MHAIVRKIDIAVKKYAALLAVSVAATLPPLDPTLAKQLHGLTAYHAYGLSAPLALTDTTPTLSDMISNVSALAGSWGIYIAAGLIFGLAVFAVYRFIRSGR